MAGDLTADDAFRQPSFEGEMIDFALIECSRIDWSKYEEVQGRADSIPLALEALFRS